jgi:hypothetical protein
MIATAEIEGRAMADKGQKAYPVRMTEEAIRWARIASGYTGESMAEYVSRTIAEQGMRDADRLHGEMTKPGVSGKPGPAGAKGKVPPAK